MFYVINLMIMVVIAIVSVFLFFRIKKRIRLNYFLAKYVIEPSEKMSF